ncbi:MAG: porin family protein [Bacteroidaceae bacterium]|nr:porin family protein [Bacteroidaceae bacterium]
MKKNILSLAVIIAALVFALPSQAQVKFGVKAGLNVNDFNVKNLPMVIDKKNRNGFFAGVTADVTIPLAGLGADASLLYDNRCIGIGGHEMDLDDNEAINEYTTTHKTFHYISLPINVKYTVGLSSLASVYLATGPQFSWNIGDRHWTLGDIDEGWELKKSQLSWNVGCGATVLSHVRVGYNYNIALGNTAETSVWNVGKSAIKGKLKNNTHQISLTYLF